MNDRKSLFGFSNLTWRSITLTALGSIIITISSIYVSLRLSALPWPTIFVAVLSMSLLKLLGETNLQEINITQTGMSSGAMVAGGIAFTIPGLWIAGIYKPFDPAVQTLREWLMPKLWPVLIVSLIGVLLGTMLCWFYRKRNIEELKLAYPIGTAAAETLEAGDQGGRKSWFLFGSMGLAAIFTVLRDQFALIPQNLEGKLGRFPVQLYASPLAVGIGYIIGFPGAAFWMLGALIAHYGLRVYGLELGTFANEASASAFILTSAVGLMVGSGVGILIQFLKTFKWKRVSADKNQDPAGNLLRNRNGLFALIVVGISFVLSILLGLSHLVSVSLMLGVVFATMMSSVITGQTGINPMEIFGIIVLLAIRLFVKVDDTQAFLIAAIVAIACGYAGDAMNDYKTGAILGTDQRAQFVTQFLGAFVGIFAAVFGLFVLILQYGGVGGETGLTAAQAHSVTAMVNGIGDPVVFGLALLVGVLLYVNGVPAMIIGIGMILSLGMASAIFLGGLVSLVVKKFAKNSEVANVGNVVSAGLLGGEGITGTILAFVAMFMR
ncbi:MAG: OPT/YSL family transporter [Anaerolineaceae bacterium]|jgi:uncharacterized oligopeptide transporter (OPT) family protein|nr:OPT/YSL family transporter [Anaerolineaceae bacterium]MDD4042905.1 OPT/YSL family transporter [Anaerolineaceae bacterium]MDD4577103.1 OPT/YSL family transporter [Anaerolineaceae bacterium]